MSQPEAPGRAAWHSAQLAAAALAVDPEGLGGIDLRACPGPVRDTWLALLKELLPAGTPWRRIPLHASEARLLGGIDLAATLRSGKPVGPQREALREAGCAPDHECSDLAAAVDWLLT